jgi:hypothetical protein
MERAKTTLIPFPVSANEPFKKMASLFYMFGELGIR